MINIDKLANILLQILKLAPRYLIIFAIVAAILLFSPESILKKIGIHDFAQNNRQWVSLIFIFSTVAIIIYGCKEIIISVWDRITFRKFHKRMAQRLKRLTEEEKQILRFYIFKQTRTNVLRSDDGVVTGLESKGIIELAAFNGTRMEGFAYNISDFAWDYLNKNQSLLTGTTDICRTDKFS